MVRNYWLMCLYPLYASIHQILICVLYRDICSQQRIQLQRLEELFKLPLGPLGMFNIPLNKYFVQSSTDDKCLVCLSPTPELAGTTFILNTHCSCKTIICFICAKEAIKNHRNTFYCGLTCMVCKQSPLTKFANVRQVAALETLLLNKTLSRYKKSLDNLNKENEIQKILETTARSCNVLEAGIKSIKQV